MPVYQCNGCEVAPCTLFILDPDCEIPTHCPWLKKGGVSFGNIPVWRELVAVD